MYLLCFQLVCIVRFKSNFRFSIFELQVMQQADYAHEQHIRIKQLKQLCISSNIPSAAIQAAEAAAARGLPATLGQSSNSSSSRGSNPTNRKRSRKVLRFNTYTKTLEIMVIDLTPTEDEGGAGGSGAACSILTTQSVCQEQQQQNVQQQEQKGQQQQQEQRGEEGEGCFLVPRHPAAPGWFPGKGANLRRGADSVCTSVGSVVLVSSREGKGGGGAPPLTVAPGGVGAGRVLQGDGRVLQGGGRVLQEGGRVLQGGGRVLQGDDTKPLGVAGGVPAVACVVAAAGAVGGVGGQGERAAVGGGGAGAAMGGGAVVLPPAAKRVCIKQEPIEEPLAQATTAAAAATGVYVKREPVEQRLVQATAPTAPAAAAAAVGLSGSVVPPAAVRPRPVTRGLLKSDPSAGAAASAREMKCSAAAAVAPAARDRKCSSAGSGYIPASIAAAAAAAAGGGIFTAAPAAGRARSSYSAMVPIKKDEEPEYAEEGEVVQEWRQGLIAASATAGGRRNLERDAAVQKQQDKVQQQLQQQQQQRKRRLGNGGAAFREMSEQEVEEWATASGFQLTTECDWSDVPGVLLRAMDQCGARKGASGGWGGGGEWILGGQRLSS